MSNLFILDWKTERRYEYSEVHAQKQLTVYGMYGHHKLGNSYENIFLQAVWLGEIGEWEPEIVSEMALATLRREINEQAQLELTKLEPRTDKRGKITYWAHRSDYLPMPERSRCFRCKFRELCDVGTDACKDAAPPVEELEAED